LESAKSLDGLFDRFVALLKDSTSSSCVSVAELRNDVFEAVGAESSRSVRDPSSDYLKYISVSEPDSQLLKERLPAGEGVTHELFVQTEEDEQPVPEPMYDADGNELPPPPVPEKPLRTLFIANVLAGPRSDQIKFFGLPQTGSYLAVRVEYDSCLHDLVFDEAEGLEREIAEAREARERERQEQEEARRAQEEYEREQELAMLTEEERIERELREEQERAEKLAAEEAKVPETEEEREARLAKEAEEKRKQDEDELYARLTKHRRRYAICLDTLGQNRRFTSAEIQVITNICKVLRDTLQCLDREQFFAERKARVMIQEVFQAAPEKSEDDRREEIERVLEEAQKQGRELSRADAAFDNRHTQIMILRQQILELRSYNVLRGPIAVLQALFYLLGFKQEQVADSDNRPDWRLIRNLINDNLITKLDAYSPREALKEKVAVLEAEAEANPKKKSKYPVILKVFEDESSYASTKSLEALLANVDLEELRARNYILYELAGFVMDSIALLHQAFQEYVEEKKAERRRLRAEEARRRAEEEEAAAAAAEGEDGMSAVAEGDEEEADE